MAVDERTKIYGRIVIKQPNVLLVEGKTDKRFFEALIRHMKLQNIQVIDTEGKASLKDRLDVIVKTSKSSQIKSIAVVRDADKDPKSAFQSVCDALKKIGLPVPTQPGKFDGGNPRVGVLILPAPDTGGALEDLCLKAVETDPAMECVTKYFECLSQNHCSFPDNEAKAKLQVFLASRKKAELRLGEAADAGYLPFDNVAFRPIMDFLKQMS